MTIASILEGSSLHQSSSTLLTAGRRQSTPRHGPFSWAAALAAVSALLLAGGASTCAAAETPGLATTAPSPVPATSSPAVQRVTSGPPTNASYAIVDAEGRIATYGGALFAGDLMGVPLNQPVVGAAPDDAAGYWMDRIRRRGLRLR